ncbi:hypothetical protein IWX77_002446 [Cryobacterium sp. CAN_C2]
MTSNAAFKKSVRVNRGTGRYPYAEARTRLLAGKSSTGLPGTSSPIDGTDSTRRSKTTDSSVLSDEYALIIGKALMARTTELEAEDLTYEAAERAWLEAKKHEGRSLSSRMRPVGVRRPV